MRGTLTGKYVVNTRALHQAETLDRLIRERDGIPVSFPCIAIQPPNDPSELDAALERLVSGAYDWLLLTSANTVYSLAQHTQALADSGAFKTAAIGPSTAQAARDQLGLSVDLIPNEHIAEALAQVVLAEGGKHIFLPESGIAQPGLREQLMAGGVHVDGIVAYQTVCGSGGVDLYAQPLDIIIFTSSSTVQGFVERTQSNRPPLDEVMVVCIGPKTAQTAQDLGFSLVMVPETYTLEGMLNAIAVSVGRYPQQ